MTERHGPLEEIEETIVELERRMLRLGRREIPLPRKRTVAVAGLVLVLVMVAGFFVLTRSAVTRMLVLPAVGRAIAADVRADGLVIEPNGEIRLRNVRARVPGIRGDAARFFSASRASVELDWSRLLRGGIAVRSVRLDDPVIRISQSSETGRLNVAGLSLLASSAGAAPSALPTLVTRGAVIEIAEHTGDTMTVLRRLRVEGAVRAADADVGGYLIELVEVATESGRAPLAVTGFFGPRGLTLALDRVALRDWGPEAVPSAVRALWQKIDLAGTVRETRFTYGLDGTVLAEMFVDGVELSLPLGDSSEGGEPAWARMTGVTGVVRFFSDRVQADLRGVLADLPYDVAIAWQGTALDAPFEATLESRGFRLEKRPGVLPFAPEIVQRRLASFGNPTGLVDARVRVSRRPADDGTLGPVRYEGTLNFRDGIAAYEHFPYRFRGLNGTFRFNNDEFVIENLTGTAPSGARITASGRIWPPTPGAQVELHINATGVPVDDTLKAALGEEKREIISALFNEPRYEALLAAGLVVDPDEAARLTAQRERLTQRAQHARGPRAIDLATRIDAIDRSLAAPPFALGGLADVQVLVRRSPGDQSAWQRTITVTLPRAGLVPEHFPLPIDASDVVIVIEGDHAHLAGGTYRALGGGEARIEADVFLPHKQGARVQPDLRIEAWDVAVDARLLHAIPDVGRGEGGRTAGDILLALGVEGTVACIAHIAPRPHTEELGFDVRVSAQGLRAKPGTGSGALSFENLTGTIDVSETQVALDLAAAVHRSDELPDPIAGLRPAGELSVQGRLDTAPADASGAQRPAMLWATVRGKGIDLSGPFEDAVEVFSPSSSTALRETRKRWQPEGVVDLSALVRGPLGGELDTRVTLTAIQSLSFQAMDGRVVLGPSEGTLTAKAGPGAFVSFDGFGTQLRYQNEQTGWVRASGTLPLGPGDEHGEEAQRMRLELDLVDARLESAMVGWFTGSRLGDGVAAWWSEHAPRGLVDASLGIWPKPWLAKPGEQAPLGIEGVVRPRTLALRAGGQDIRFDTLDGVLEFDESGGVITGLRASADGWTLSADGNWALPEPGALVLRGSGALESAGLPASLRVLMPEGVGSLLSSLSIEATGPVRVSGLTVSGSRAAGDERWAFSADGGVSFEDAAGEAGLPFRGADGSLQFSSTRARPDLPAEFDLRLLADRALVAGVETTNMRVRVMSGERDREVLVPLISADCHGGRIAGEAVMAPIDPGPEAPLRYAATINASGVELAPTLGDLSRTMELNSMGQRRNNEDFDARTGDRSRGLLDAEVGLSGTVGVPSSRRGRGSVQVAGGRVINIPGVVPLIEVSNLQLPAGERLDYARAVFFIDDQRVSFEDLSVYSSNIEILGFGTMTWPGRELDFRFNSRASRRIPVVSDVLEGIRDELISTHVVGPLSDYQIKVVQLTATRALLGKVFGAQETEQDLRLGDLKRRAAEERERMSRPSAQSPEGG